MFTSRHSRASIKKRNFSASLRSPENNGMEESFVKTMKCDYISIMSKPDGLTVVKKLAEAFDGIRYSALGYHSLREYLGPRTSNG